MRNGSAARVMGWRRMPCLAGVVFWLDDMEPGVCLFAPESGGVDMMLQGFNDGLYGTVHVFDESAWPRRQDLRAQIPSIVCSNCQI